MSAWLIDTVLYTGLLIGLVLVLRRPVGRFFGPQLAYSLWALPFLRLLLPPIVLPASLAPEPVQAPVADWVPVPAEAPIEATAAPVVATATLPPPAWEWADLVAPAVSVWAGIALAFLFFRVVTYRRMRRELLEGARPVGEIGRIRMVESPALAAPVALGVLDKVIALPPLFMAQPDIASRDLAIAHELAHHKGHDLLANFAAQALLALHWFNPLAWYGWRAMRRDQEAACDARVLAGRGREERLTYAALIAGIATGPRSIAFERALAAPMACPVLGERSIVHRLRSLSMSEMSRRRRWFGRSLLAASALALPLTASISYAAANAPAASPAPDAQPAALAAPEAATAIAAAAQVSPSAVAESDTLLHPHPAAHPFEIDGAPAMPQLEALGDPTDPEWQARMETWGREMEEWGEKWGEQWGEQQREQALALAEQHREQALAQAEQRREQALARAERQREQGERQREQAEQRREQALALAEQQRGQAQAWANAARYAPEVVQSCDDDERRRTTTADGRPRVVICPRETQQIARSSLRFARDSIAGNHELSAEIRREVLRDLDAEIERLERENN